MSFREEAVSLQSAGLSISNRRRRRRAALMLLMLLLVVGRQLQYIRSVSHAGAL